MLDCDKCLKLEEITYPSHGVHPPELYKYPKPKPPITLLFLGWNPPKPYGGFWSLEFPDNLRRGLHSILQELGHIKAPAPDQNFLDEFLQKGFYFIHTVKCWAEPKFPGFGRDAQSREGRLRKSTIGLPYGVVACLYFSQSYLDEGKVASRVTLEPTIHGFPECVF